MNRTHIAPSNRIEVMSHVHTLFRRFATLLATALLAGILSACGGGDDGPSVVNITATPLRYGQPAVFTLVGRDLLTANLRVRVSLCSGLTTEAGATEEQVRIGCRVSGTGTVQVDVLDATDTLLLSKHFEVPAPQVQMETTLGMVTLELYPQDAPITVSNFLAYVTAGFYDGVLFHSVVKDFLVQGGGYSAGLVFKTPVFDPIALEFDRPLRHVRGTVGMARKNTPNSATSQFFVNLVDNPRLDFEGTADPGYAAFGRVVDGMAVFDRMATLPVATVGTLTTVPATEIRMISVRQTR